MGMIGNSLLETCRVAERYPTEVVKSYINGISSAIQVMALKTSCFFL